MISHANSGVEGSISPRPLWIYVVFMTLFATSLTGNVLLGWKVKSLVHPRLEAQTGTQLHKLEVETLGGQDLDLTFAGKEDTVLYIFRPGCKWCGLNLANIQSLSTSKNIHARFLGISTTQEGLKEYLSQAPLPFPVYTIHAQSELQDVDFIGTPQTIQISPYGVILHNWVGAYSDQTASSIENTFGVKLPSAIKLRP